jgi:hypothetical protein
MPQVQSLSTDEMRRASGYAWVVARCCVVAAVCKTHGLRGVFCA